MSYAFPPELERLVHEKMASGHYPSEDALLLDAMRALEDVELRHRLLRDEIRERLEHAGTGESEPLDVDAFLAEARERLQDES